MVALNEVGGQSLVFVQTRRFFHGEPRYTLHRVSVVNRLEKVAQVRSRLSDEDRAQMKREEGQGKRPIEPLHAGQWVATGGVVEMTDALEDLLANQGRQ
jgi:hypothetical protein